MAKHCKFPPLLRYFTTKFSIPVVDVIKLFLEEIEIFPKLRNLKKFVLMSEPEQKCENNAVFKQNYTAKLLITFKMAYSCCFSLGGNVDFLDFLQKSFITLTSGERTFLWGLIFLS